MVDSGTIVPVDARTRVVGAQDVAQRERVRGGLHARHVERGDVAGVIDHPRELTGEQVELLVGERQARERGHVGDVVAPERRRLGHVSSSPGRGAVTESTKDSMRSSTSSWS